MIDIKDITVIVPVHVWNDNVKEMFDRATGSIPEGASLMISAPENCEIELSDDLKKRISNITVNIVTGKCTSFQHMVNSAASLVKTDWFSILEFDDEYTPMMFKNFIKYQEYNQEYNFFYTLCDLYNVEDGKNEFIGNGNEVAWASSFSDELGVIDEKSVEDYFNFYPTGGVFNTKTWNDMNGLKESIKLTFWYEFMLRALKKGEKFYVIPKIGYRHILGRDNSLLMQYRKGIDEKESDFWFRTAKSESFFDKDRNKTYSKKD